MLRKFLNLSNCQKVIFVVAWYKLCIVSILLWMWSYKKTKNWLDKRESKMKANEDGFRCVRKISYLVKIASRFVPFSTNLTEALVTKWMLKKVGYDSILHVDRSQENINDLNVHVMLEIDGEVIIESDKYLNSPSYDHQENK